MSHSTLTLKDISVEQVRVHRDLHAASAIGSIGFFAPAAKENMKNIYIAPGSKDIHIAPGKEEHQPHEAWHVVQQRR